MQELKPEELTELSTADCVQRCRTMASQAQHLSKNAEGEARNAYFALSVHWMALANEIEQSKA